MKSLFATTAIIMLSGLPAYAAVIDTNSTIDAATVFTEGATITRTADFTSPAGSHQIVIDDLPLNFDANSLRVTGDGTAAFRIVSVDHRIRRQPPREQTDSAAYKALEEELDALTAQFETLSFDMRTIDTKIVVADGRLQMVETLMEREPQNMVNDAAYTPRDATDWGVTIGALAEQMEIALLAKIDAEREKSALADTMNDLGEEIAKTRQQMAATQLPARENSIATIEIVAEAPLDGTLNLEYRTANAGWRPIYDLRLTQGVQADLSIERHAKVYQHTGEAWDDVTLTLSTARPSLRMDVPMFREQIALLIDPATERVDNMVTPMAVQAPQRSVATQGVAREEATPTPVRYETRGRTVIYSIPERADIDGDGTSRQLFIDSKIMTVETSARATPRLDPSAYLYATLDNTFDGPILPGDASSYVDGAFIGKTYLPFTAADDALDLPFGVIDGLTIDTVLTGREKGDYGFVSTTNTQEEAFMLTASSVLPYDIDLIIYDRAPVSENEDLVIEVTANPRASETNVNGVRGLTAWTLDMKADSTQSITFGYELSWPGDLKMVLSNPDWPLLHSGQGLPGSFR